VLGLFEQNFAVAEEVGFFSAYYTEASFSGVNAEGESLCELFKGEMVVVCERISEDGTLEEAHGPLVKRAVYMLVNFTVRGV